MVPQTTCNGSLVYCRSTFACENWFPFQDNNGIYAPTFDHTQGQNTVTLMLKDSTTNKLKGQTLSFDGRSTTRCHQDFDRNGQWKWLDYDYFGLIGIYKFNNARRHIYSMWNQWLRWGMILNNLTISWLWQWPMTSNNWPKITSIVEAPPTHSPTLLVVNIFPTRKLPRVAFHHSNHH